MSNSIVWSIKNGDLSEVQQEIEKQNQNINENVNGRTLLHFAADYGQTDIVKYLISKGAQVDVLDKHGISPLLAAIWEGHTECVKLLLSGGASKVGKAPDGSSYLEAAEKPEIKALLTA